MHRWIGLVFLVFVSLETLRSFNREFLRFIEFSKVWQTSGDSFSRHTGSHIFQGWKKQYILRKLLLLYVFSLFSIWQHPWVLNHSCQVGLSATMTQFQINLSHIFYTVSLTRLQSHWGVSLSSCGSARSGTLLCKLLTQVCSNLSALLPDLVSLQCFESSSSFLTAVEVLFLASLIFFFVFFLQRQVECLHQISWIRVVSVQCWLNKISKQVQTSGNTMLFPSQESYLKLWESLWSFNIMLLHIYISQKTYPYVADLHLND